MFPKSIGFDNSGKSVHRQDLAKAVSLQGPVGLVRGSLVWTADGALPVEYLVRGDKVVTRHGGLAESGMNASTDLLDLCDHFR